MRLAAAGRKRKRVTLDEVAGHCRTWDRLAPRTRAGPRHLARRIGSSRRELDWRAISMPVTQLLPRP